MHIPDLSRETYFGLTGSDLRSVGWLDGDHPYSKGPVSAQFIDALRRHVKTAWQPFIFLGPHFCELCEGETYSRSAGIYNLWIPSVTVVYIAPELIVHYIDAHGYRPPDEFMDAVLHCPPQASPEYVQMIKPYLHYWVDADQMEVVLAWTAEQYQAHHKSAAT